MSSEWKEYTLDEFSTINPRESIKKGAIAKKVPMDVLGEFKRNISEFSKEEFKGGTKFRNGDTLLARITPCLQNGKTAFVDILEENEIGFGSTEYIVLREKENISDAKFIFYLSISPQLRNIAIQSMTGSSGRQRVQTDVLKNHIFNLPPLQEQKRIAHILGTLDDKIELNRKMNETLEAMAQALFKSWFVDFDPVIDNALAAGNEIPEQFKERARSRSVQAKKGKFNHLFPSSFTFNESLNKWIPEGWEVKLSGDVIDVRDGTHASPKKSESGYPLVTSKHITSGKLDLSGTYLISQEDFIEVNKRSQVQTKDILLTMIGTVGIPCIILEGEINFAIKNVGLFRTSENKSFANYFFQFLKSSSTQNYLEARMAGTTQKYLSLKVLREIEFFIPPSNLLNEFDGKLNSIYNKIHSTEKEIKSLIKSRDTLLPKLISGKIKV